MRQLANRYWWLLPIAVVVVAAVVAVQVVQSDSDSAPQAGLVDCATEAPDDFDCWRDRLRAQVRQENPGAALDYIRDSHHVPFVETQCHQLVHEVGRAAGERYGEVGPAFKEGYDLCASGYFHGVLESVADEIGVDGLVADIEAVCADFKAEKPYGSDHYNCVHGLGHGLMGVMVAELYNSLEACDGYEESWERESCYSGAFMENIIAKDSDHHPSIYLKDDDPLYPCTEVDDRYLNQCYNMQTSHALNVVGRDFAEVFRLCQSEEVGDYAATCLQSLGRDVSGTTVNRPQETINLCMLDENEFAQEHCVIGAVKDYVYHHQNTDLALEMCGMIENARISTVCSDTAVSFFDTF